ncbi:hypothetical protein GCG54_00002783 [Colletotrichum gloeosporioides]|uniref:Uncharacterized protein n=1 Tax=Colletotrichum gloeosporioides TaxID=474922 RepID=A0A8H4CK35_COLGL|nr:uncharacterized protein GCG54_00002783 [Colletotrichum gloeosporioides]KAF3805438.1 hypothetical protein GCG54_00002783 [Colletotrichum gloeosporioides]
MKLTAAFASLLATLAATAPTHQDDDPVVVFGISDPLLTLLTASNGIVTNVFIYSPGNNPARCAFLEPEPRRQGLGAVSIIHATTIELSPPEEVGFVQCNRT